MSVSVQQAAANALAAWLGSKMPDVEVVSRWPGKHLPKKAISIVPAGRRRDTPLDSRLLSSTPTGPVNTTGIWQIAACYQPYQLDVWTDNYLARDDIMARLDAFLRADATPLAAAYNPNPVGNGLLVDLADGWDAANTIADFTFDSPDTSDTPNSVQQSEYRATYRGGANVMLSVTAVTARQKAIYFQLLLNQEPFTTFRIA